MEDKVKGCLILHAIGDTLGYYNGKFEFNFGLSPSKLTLNTTLEIVYEFINLGGITDINLNGWKVSDDTILHIQTAHALVNSDINLEKFMKHIGHNTWSYFKIIVEVHYF